MVTELSIVLIGDVRRRFGRVVKIEQTAKRTGYNLINQLFPFLIVAMLASEDKPWFQVFKAAMLELDARKLPERIVAAKEAVQSRLRDLQGDSDHHAERQQIEDALNSLRVLEREK